MNNKKQYEKPHIELLKLQGDILLASGKDPFATDDVRFAFNGK